MQVVCFTNALTLGGAEKAAGQWAAGLNVRGHKVKYVSLQDGPRRADLALAGIPLEIPRPGNMISELADIIAGAQVIHTHAPGYPHEGDVLGEALQKVGKKIPVIQSNIFGKLNNPREDQWTSFRLFISWTSCVQAARRAGRKLDSSFFRRQSVAAYPLYIPNDEAMMRWSKKAKLLRSDLDLKDSDVVFGRFSRPEPNKWTPLVLNAFLEAAKVDPNIRLILREPPPAVAELLKGERTVKVLRATADPEELAVTQMACDGVLHTSSVGESFGYGLAEPMNLGKPVITNSVPWHDQAQIEMVRHGECGFTASTLTSMKQAILRLASDADLRQRMGSRAQQHIRTVADMPASLDRLEHAITCAVDGPDNSFATEDMLRCESIGQYLDQHQWGHTAREQLALRTFDARIRFSRWRRGIWKRWNP